MVSPVKARYQKEQVVSISRTSVMFIYIYVCVSVCVCIYIYMCVYVCVCVILCFAGEGRYKFPSHHVFAGEGRKTFRDIWRCTLSPSHTCCVSLRWLLLPPSTPHRCDSLSLSLTKISFPLFYSDIEDNDEMEQKLIKMVLLRGGERVKGHSSGRRHVPLSLWLPIILALCLRDMWMLLPGFRQSSFAPHTVFSGVLRLSSLFFLRVCLLVICS